MKKILLFPALIFMMLIPSMLSAWQPSGWVWFSSPNAYDHGNATWYYFSETDSQYYLDWGTWEWKSVTTASGWHYFDWPWSYSWNNQEWNYWSQTDQMYVMNWTSGNWSRFGEAGSNGSGGVPEGMVGIPVGWFTMGRISGDTDSNAPPVNVYVSGFYIARHPVTWALWNEVRNWAVQNGYTDIGTGGGKAANHPVHSVSWHDAIKWLNARSEREGLTPVYRNANGTVYKTGMDVPTANWNANGYRLPTEAEWEKAARGGVSGWRFPWGNTITHSLANYSSFGSYTYDLSQTRSYHPDYNDGTMPYTSPVGSFEPNEYGLYDTSGNVGEWCYDWYSATIYADGATNPRGPPSGGTRVLRGGSWSDDARSARSSDRNARSQFTRSDRYGFRAARSP